MSKAITLYSHASGPNPWKVAIVLEELGVPYKHEWIDFGAMKQKPYIDINPNGRVPAIIDHSNGDIQIFESGAIIEYLIERYDSKGEKLTYPSSAANSDNLKYQQRSWLHFQTSGQGPYYGQAAWFANFHKEKLPSAVERYQAEIKRVLGVIEYHLKKTGTEYLVGDRVTYADLAWITWNNGLGWLLGQEFDFAKEFPLTSAWHNRLVERPAVKKVLEEKQAAMAKGR